LDLKATETKDVYDLQFTLIGNYTNITDYLYDIENDEELNFEIKEFTISSASATTQTNNTNTSNNPDTNSNTNKTQKEDTNANKNTEQNNQAQSTTDGNMLQAKFTVENVGITLD